MTLVWKRRDPRKVGMTRAAVASIALTLSETNRRALIFTKADPFLYLNMLREEYGITALARPARRDRKIIGYYFKNAS